MLVALWCRHNHRITVGGTSICPEMFESRIGPKTGEVEWQTVPAYGDHAAVWTKPLVWDRNGIPVDLLRPEFNAAWQGGVGQRKGQLVDSLSVAGVKRPPAKR